MKSKLSDSGIRYSSRTDDERHHQLEQEMTALRKVQTYLYRLQPSRIEDRT